MRAGVRADPSALDNPVGVTKSKLGAPTGIPPTNAVGFGGLTRASSIGNGTKEGLLLSSYTIDATTTGACPSFSL